MLTLKEYKELHRVVDQIFREAKALGYSWEKLADIAGLTSSTVYRLGNLDTMFPRAQTVFMLAKAVGMKVSLVVRRIKLSRSA